ncbi:MAG TPA: hypothetical protein VIM11_02565, partial [Tepidisphaeraceae bacterium]
LKREKRLAQEGKEGGLKREKRVAQRGYATAGRGGCDLIQQSFGLIIVVVIARRRCYGEWIAMDAALKG